MNELFEYQINIMRNLRLLSLNIGKNTSQSYNLNKKHVNLVNPVRKILIL